MSNTGIILTNHGTQIKRVRPRFTDDYTEGLALEVYTDRGVGRIELDHDELQRLLKALPTGLLFAALDANPLLALPPQDLDSETRLAELRLHTPAPRVPLAAGLAEEEEPPHA